MYLIPPGETIAEKKICRISGEEFFVTDKDIQFLESVSPIFNGQKYLWPSQDISPLEMRRNLLGFRNQNKLYKRKSDKTGNEIISAFAPEVPFPIYENQYWYSDAWSPLECGQKIDFEKGFFDQWYALNKNVPRPACSRHSDTNSLYANNCANVKDCYLCFNGLFNENCMYCQTWDYSKNCIDSECIFECENCYHLSLSRKCYSCFYSHELTNCQECVLCYDCIGCSNCIGCYNLRNKTYYLFNQPSTPEAIKSYLEKQRKTLFSHETLQKVISQGIHKYASTVQSEDCFGNEFQSSKNCFDSYYMMNAEDCVHCDNGKEQKDCRYVMNGMKNLSNSYCCQTVGINCSNLAFIVNSTENLSEVYYSNYVYFGATKCFGCIGLHAHEHHCILNTAYSAQEYETLAAKLADHMRATGEWGQFFPRHFSPVEYNESLAGDLFPLTREEAQKQGWNWREESSQTALSNSGTQILSIEQYDEKIVGYEIAQKNIDTLLAGMIVCPVSGKPFKILKQELVFYIENSLPIATKHPEVRHREMLSLRNKRTLDSRNCDECQKEILTTFSKNGSGKIVCEDCYRKLVY